MNPINCAYKYFNNLKLSNCKNSKVWNYLFNYPQYEKKILENISNRWDVDNNKANTDLEQIITSMKLYAEKTWKIVIMFNIRIKITILPI